MMKYREIRGKNAFAEYTKTRTACRGVVLRDGKILLCYETETDLWMLPGGGLEKGESSEDCCIREICEESGYLVSPEECFLKLDEYYEEWKFVSYFFVCGIVGIGERKPTDRELSVGMEPRWIPLEDAISIFSHHADHDGTDEEKRGIYEREYEALSALRNI